jgi:NADH-quinone oxidoreductase subunit M
LSVIGILYGAFCALSQRDMKKLVAYSSVSHLGFCMLGLFALNAEGLAGGTLQMINHGLSTGALFLLVGMIYERLHTRQLDDMGGLASRLPVFSVCLVFACLSSMGLPGLNGFVGETLSLIGMFRVHPGYAVIATSGIILGAWYLLNLLRYALFGTQSKKLAAHTDLPDLNSREIFSLAPIMALCVLIGVFPQPFIDVMKPEVDAIAAIYADKLPDPLAVKEIEANGQLAAALPTSVGEDAR